MDTKPYEGYVIVLYIRNPTGCFTILTPVSTPNERAEVGIDPSDPQVPKTRPIACYEKLKHGKSRKFFLIVKLVYNIHLRFQPKSLILDSSAIESPVPDSSL